MKKKSFKGRVILSVVAIGLASLSLSGCSEKSSEEHMLAARQFVEAKDVKSAIVEYKNAIQKNPRDASARFELGKVYIDQNNFPAAEKELNRAAELGYDMSEVLPLLAKAYQKTGSEVALSEVNHNETGLTPVKQAEVIYYKLEALLKLDKQFEARQLIDEVRTIDTSSVYKGLALALGDVLNENYETALEKINALHEQAPLNKDVLLQQARMNMFMKNIDKAVIAYQEYIKVATDDIETQFILAAILMDNKRFDEAEPVVNSLLEISSTHPLLNQFKGLIEVRKGNFESSLKYLETAIQNGRTDPIARLVAGFSAYNLKDYEATTRHLSMIASDLPPSHPALRMLADSLLKEGNSEEASDVLSRVDGGDESDALLFSKAGYELLKSGNVVDAKAMIEKSVPIATTAEDLTRIGVLQLSINDVEGLVNLEAAVERSPDLNVSQQTLANAYIVTKQYDKALDVANAWIEKEPENVVPLQIKTQVYLAQNELEMAEETINKAERIDDKNVKNKIQRVSLALVKNQPEEAVTSIKEALTIDPTDQSALALYYIAMRQGGKANEAIDYLKEVMKRYPDADSVKMVLARVLLNEEQYAEGLAVINKLTIDETYPFAYWDTKGKLLVTNNKVVEAREHYETWLKVQPNNKVAMLGLAMILDVQNKFSEGIKVTAKFLEKRPDRQIEILKAYFHSMLKQIVDAEKIIDKLTPEEKALPFVRGIVARLQIFREDYKASVPNAEAAYQAMPNTRNLLLVMAAYETTDQPEKAIEIVESFLEKNPDSVQAQLLYAERIIGRDTPKAISLYRSITEKQPENAIALNNLAFLEYEEGMLDDAEEHARAAMEIAPQAPEIVDTLAQILVKKGELEDAKEIYDGVVDVNVRNDEIYLNYIELLLKLDLKPLAQRRLNERMFESKEAQQRLAELKETYKL